jgi:CRISPR-associated protein Cmr6
VTAGRGGDAAANGSWRPLYESSRQAHLQPGAGNLGLWYVKYLNRWPQNRRLGGSEKAAWILAASGLPCSPARLAEYRARQDQVIWAQGGRVRRFRTATRLAVGLGSPHPLEVGLTWEYSLGVPYVPASSLKGVARAWATQWVGAPEAQRIFGEIAKSGWDAPGVGTVRFFDALPVSPPPLVGDVMTPHYPNYYKNPAVGAHDWESPVPVPFITVDAGAEFAVAIAPRTAAAQPDVERVAQWIEEALDWVGVGAKSSSGYGRLAPVSDWRVEHPPTPPAPCASPLQRELEADGYPEARFMEALTVTWLPRLDTEANPTTRRELAQLLADWYRASRPDQWEKPQGKNVDKVRKIRDALQ